MRWLYNIMAKQSAPPVFTFNCKINIFETACNSIIGTRRVNKNIVIKYFQTISVRKNIFLKKPLKFVTTATGKNFCIYRTRIQKKKSR